MNLLLIAFVISVIKKIEMFPQCIENWCISPIKPASLYRATEKEHKYLYNSTIPGHEITITGNGPVLCLTICGLNAGLGHLHLGHLMQCFVAFFPSSCDFIFN